MSITPTLEAERAAPKLLPCPECQNEYLAIRTDIYEDKREFVYCDCCECIAVRSVWNAIRRTAAPVAEDVALPPKQSIDTDEFRELFFAARHASWNFDGRTPEFDALIAYIDGRTAASAWVSVDDERKPEPKKPVLLFVRTLTRGEDDDGRPHETEGAEVAMGEYRKGESDEMSYFDCYTSPMSDNDWITHWMRLPAAPSHQPVKK